MKSAEIINPEKPQHIDALRLFIANGTEFIQEVRKARSRARHRQVKVGAMAIGISPSGRIGQAIAANQNLDRGRNVTKQCAEQRAIKSLRKRGFTRAPFLIVCGDVQPDTQSRVVTPCLHNCGECRCFMAAAPETKDGVVSLLIHTEKDAFEVYDDAELKRIHNPKRRSEPRFHYFEDPGFTHWPRGQRAEEMVGRMIEPLQNGYPLAEAIRQTITGRLPVEAAQLSFR